VRRPRQLLVRRAGRNHVSAAQRRPYPILHALLPRLTRPVGGGCLSGRRSPTKRWAVPGCWLHYRVEHQGGARGRDGILCALSTGRRLRALPCPRMRAEVAFRPRSALVVVPCDEPYASVISLLESLSFLTREASPSELTCERASPVGPRCRVMFDAGCVQHGGTLCASASTPASPRLREYTPHSRGPARSVTSSSGAGGSAPAESPPTAGSTRAQRLTGLRAVLMLSEAATERPVSWF